MNRVLRNYHSNLSRRGFLTASAGAGGAILLGPTGLYALDEVDPRVAKVMSRTIGIDMQNHVYPAGTEPHPQHGPQHGKSQNGGPGGPPRRQEEQQQGPELLIADELKRSGLTAVCASFVLDFAPNNKPGDARENVFR